MSPDQFGRGPNDNRAHVVLAREFARQIEAGIWQPGQALPRTVDIVSARGLSHATVYQAMSVLCKAGYTISRGQSRYVAPRLPAGTKGKK